MIRSKHECRIPQIPFHEAILLNVRYHEDKVALVMASGDRKAFTYKQIYQAMVSLGSAFTRLGLVKGDVVAICLPNCPELILSLLGVSSIGGVTTGVNFKYTAYELKHQLADCKAKVILTFSKNIPNIQRIVNEQNSKVIIKDIITMDERVEGCLYFWDFLSDNGSAFPTSVPFDVKEDLALIMYSSGTTGLPKGVMLTHYNLVSQVFACTDPAFLPQTQPYDEVTVLLYLPLFHMFGVIILLSTLHLGAKLILLNGFRPREFLRSLQDYRVNWLYVVPPTATFLAKSTEVDQYDLTSINMVRSSAAPLTAESVNELQARLKLDAVCQGYGITETTALVTVEPYGKAKQGSSGILTMNTMAKTIDPCTGRVLPRNEKGEIHIHTPHRMKGYLNRPEATAEVIDKDGWFKTGDIGYFDDDGYLFITGRIKELIKYKGFQVAPAEVEGLILTHPGVADVAVIGIPDAASGELPRAFVVKKPNNEVTETAIQNLVRENLSNHKWLRGGVQFVSQIPKTASGKIVRREVKKLITNSKI